MRRWLYIAAFSLILLTLPVWAQRRGGGSGGGHFSSGGGHSFAGHSFSGQSSGAFHGGSVSHSSGIRLRIGNPYYNRRGFYGRGYYPYYPYAGYYPYGYYGWYDNSLAYNTDNEDQDAYAGASYPAPYPENGGLQRDVQALNGKIDRLQADVEARNRPKTDQEPATALVFRDQHVEEVR